MYSSAGELRYLIDFQEPRSKKATASGYVPTEWKTWAYGVRAKKEETGGTESLQAGGRQESLKVTWSIRYMSVRKPSVMDKIIWRGRVFNIDAVNDPDGRERQLEIQATQVAVIANA